MSFWRMPTSAFARHRGSTGLLYPLNSVGTHCCVLDVNFRITSSIWVQNYEEFSYYQKFLLIITKKGCLNVKTLKGLKYNPSFIRSILFLVRRRGSGLRGSRRCRYRPAADPYRSRGLSVHRPGAIWACQNHKSYGRG